MLQTPLLDHQGEKKKKEIHQVFNFFFFFATHRGTETSSPATAVKCYFFCFACALIPKESIGTPPQHIQHNFFLLFFLNFSPQDGAKFQLSRTCRCRPAVPTQRLHVLVEVVAVHQLPGGAESLDHGGRLRNRVADSGKRRCRPRRVSPHRI